MLIARQDGAPARLVQTTHSVTDLLTAARLKNVGEKQISSYRVGWAHVRQNGIEFHAGPWISVPAGIKPGIVSDVPDQSIPFDVRAERVVFFVAELKFADGSRWKAPKQDIERTARLKFP
jgi:hypothetical protein